MAGASCVQVQRHIRPGLRLGHPSVVFLFCKLHSKTPLKPTNLPGRDPVVSFPPFDSSGFHISGCPVLGLCRSLQLPTSQGMALHYIHYPASYRGSCTGYLLYLDPSDEIYPLPCSLHPHSPFHTCHPASFNLHSPASLCRQLSRRTRS